MAEAYGTEPHRLLDADLTAAEAFWFNSDVWDAVRKFERMVKEMHGNTSDQDQAAQQLAQAQEQRSELKQRDQNVSEVSDQMQALEQARMKRQAEGEMVMHSG